jgi:hypothetical protein
MIRDNFNKLGQPKQAKWTWMIGGGAILALMALSILAEQRLGRAAPFSFGVVLAITAAEIAKRTQGAALENHWNSGGRAQPLWRVFLLLALGVALLLFGTFQLTAMLSRTAKLEGGHEVSISGQATEADAVRVGAVLTEVGTLSPRRPIHFSLGRSKKGWSLEFTLLAGALTDEEIRTGTELVAKTLRERAFGGAPLEIRLTGARGFVQKRLEVDGLGDLAWH